MDRTSKFLVLLVALGLFANAVPRAQAADQLECKIDGPIEVRVESIGDDIEVKWAFSAPGSSSSSPLYVQTGG